ncbi:MAG TPA: selenium cofactor biosynthesis protein YqeC [Anaerolineales bacterium]|nr:selenium cofactor biosynthesis protein YqeC [Anaerolineales bacterium]
MNLSQALRLPKTPRLALVGAGGKTTALFQLARQLPPPVLVAATTHLGADQTRLADSHWIAERPADLAGLEEKLQGVILVTGPVEADRTTGLAAKALAWLHELGDSHGLPLLVEADGSRRRPLKAPAATEPPIPEFAQTVVVVAGLSGLGRPLTDEFVHRPEVFARLGGLGPGDPVTPEALARVLLHREGGLKSIPPGARRVALLNQADTPDLQSLGGKLAGDLLGEYAAVLVGALERDLLQAFEQTAGIVLAGGEARRFGSPKQLLDYHGRPFVRAVAETALAAGLSPVVVVSGANAGQVEDAVRDLPVRMAHNPDWPSGQSSSLQAGLRALPEQAGAAIFLLADQPQVTPTVLRALADRHGLDLAPVVAPLVDGRRANPVLFDRVTFPDLLSLTGDVGGRAVFSKFPLTYLPWHDASLLLDVDRPEDYEKLLDRRI